MKRRDTPKLYYPVPLEELRRNFYIHVLLAANRWPTLKGRNAPVDPRWREKMIQAWADEVFRAFVVRGAIHLIPAQWDSKPKVEVAEKPDEPG